MSTPTTRALPRLSTRLGLPKYKLQKCGDIFNAVGCPICPYCKANVRKR